jgi:hypothetical protein
MRRVGALTALEESDAEQKSWFTAFEEGLA